jgi:hypothetical protein
LQQRENIIIPTHARIPPYDNGFTTVHNFYLENFDTSTDNLNYISLNCYIPPETSLRPQLVPPLEHSLFQFQNPRTARIHILKWLEVVLKVVCYFDPILLKNWMSEQTLMKVRNVKYNATSFSTGRRGRDMR